MSFNSSLQECGACGEGSLIATRGVRAVEHHGEKEYISQKSHTCDSCGAILFDEADVRENRRAWLRFKKHVDKIPLGCEIAAMRIQASLTQKAAGDLFGGGPVAFSKYENDDLVPDDAMINLLKLAIAYPDTVTRLADVKRKPIRIHVYQHIKVSVSLDDVCEGAFELAGFPEFFDGEMSMFRNMSNSKLSTVPENSWKLN